MSAGRGDQSPSTGRDQAARDRQAAATDDKADRAQAPADRHSPRPDDTTSSER